MKLKTNGYSLVELMVVLALIIVILMYGTMRFNSGRHARCMNTHLKLWNALILQARAQALLHKNIIYVKIGSTDDEVPYIIGLQDNNKSLFQAADRYSTVLGDPGNLDSGDLAPCSNNLRGIRLLNASVLPTQPPDWEGNNNGLPEFQNNVFGITPSGLVVDVNNRPFSGAFYFGYQNIENQVENWVGYSSIYVTATGAVRTYYLDASDTNNWSLVQ